MTVSMTDLRLIISDLSQLEPDQIAGRIGTDGVRVSKDDCPLTAWLTLKVGGHITVGYDGDVQCDHCGTVNRGNETGGWHVMATFAPLTLESALAPSSRWARLDLGDGTVVQFLDRFECGHYPYLRLDETG